MTAYMRLYRYHTTEYLYLEQYFHRCCYAEYISSLYYNQVLVHKVTEYTTVNPEIQARVSKEVGWPSSFDPTNASSRLNTLVLL